MKSKLAKCVTLLLLLWEFVWNINLFAAAYYFLSDYQCREMHRVILQSLKGSGWMGDGGGGQDLSMSKILATALLPTAGPEVFSLSPLNVYPKIFVCVWFFFFWFFLLINLNLQKKLTTAGL